MALGHIKNKDIGNMRSNLPLRVDSVVIDNWKNMYHIIIELLDGCIACSQRAIAGDFRIK